MTIPGLESTTYPLGYHPPSSRGCGTDMINTNLIVNRLDHTRLESTTYPLGHHPPSNRGCGTDMINTNLIVNRLDPTGARIHYLPSNVSSTQ